MRSFTLIILALASIVGWAQKYEVQTVPNPKTASNSYVSNPDKILDNAAEAEINSILGQVEAQTSAEVAVVAVQSIGDGDVFEFSQSLFNYWGIGKAKENNGLLVLLVLDQKTVRFHSGYGIEGILPDIVCKKIQREKMLPHFKENNYSVGMVMGIREVATLLTDSTYASNNLLQAEAEGSTLGTEAYDLTPLYVVGGIGWAIIALIMWAVGKSKNSFTDSPKFDAGSAPHIKMSSKQYLVWFLFLPLGIFIIGLIVNQLSTFLMALYGYIFLGAADTKRRMNAVTKSGLAKADYYGLHQFYRKKRSFWVWMAILVPVPFLFLVFRYGAKMKLFREHPRNCPTCGKPMESHSETSEDPHLNPKQIFEENIKSVDYDVWQCTGCGSKQVLRYPTDQSTYEECPKCSTVAYYVASNRILRAATTSSEGLKEEIKICKYCQFKNTRTFSTPKLSSSSSGGSGGGGSSFGGGRSGGGGASSSW